MKLDITKLPLGEALVGFVFTAVVLTFVLAFAYPTQSGLKDKAAAGSPTPGATPTPQGTPGGTPGGAVAVGLKDNFFEPKDLTVKAGASVTFQLKNDGVAVHNMRIAGADGKYNTEDDAASDPNIIQAGGTGAVTWTAPAQAGQVQFQCDFHVALGMVGTITVQ